MITEEHAKPPPIAVPSQVNHFSKFIYFQYVTQEEQGRAQVSHSIPHLHVRSQLIPEPK